MTAFTEPQDQGAPQTADQNRAVMAMELADRMLEQVATTDDAQKLIDMAEMARVYARQSKLGTSSINHATVIKLRAEKKLANIVDEGQRRGEIAVPQDNLREGSETRTARIGDVPPAQLGDLGIDSSRLREARIIRDSYTDEDLVARQQHANDNDEVLSRRALIEEARRMNAVNAEIQSKRVDYLYPVYEALKALSSVPTSAAEWAEAVPSYSAHRVTDNLAAATEWLNALKESWNK